MSEASRAVTDAYEAWWNDEGSFPPNPGEDHEEHLHRISKIAWQKGAASVTRDTEAPCQWVEDEDGCYDTSCGECFAFSNDEGLEGNRFKFCHHCGGPIQVAYHEER